MVNGELGQRWAKNPLGWGLFVDRSAPIPLATYKYQETAFIHGVFLAKYRELILRTCVNGKETS